jgi:hypothetical protein
MNLDFWLRYLPATGMMNDFVRQEVPPFRPEVARDFLAELLSSEALAAEPDVPDALLACVEPAIPFWLQVLVWELVQDPGRRRAITSADVRRAYTERVIGNAGRHLFQPYEERLGRYEPGPALAAKRILSHLARMPADQCVQRATLGAIFAQTTGDDAPETFDATFADLQSEFYITWDPDTDCARFAHKVLRDWWLHWHP